jgi:hypothetical protein
MWKKSIYYVGLSMITAVFVSIVVAIVGGYERTLGWVIAAWGWEKHEANIYTLFSKSKFYYFLLAACALTAISAVLFHLFCAKVVDALCSMAKEARLFFVQGLSTKLTVVLALPALFVVALWFFMPVSYDEAWTYLNFTRRGAAVSLLYYPAPNNHILHSIFTNITHLLPFDDPLIKLRLSSVIAHILFMLVFFSMLNIRYGPRFSAIVSGIAFMTPMSLYYGYMSRGYIWTMLSFVVGLSALYVLSEDEKKSKAWFIFGTSAFVGFAAMPSYLYAYIILCFILIANNPRAYIRLALGSAIVAASVFVFYLPVILVNGWAALAQNKYVAPISREEVVDRIPVFFMEALGKIFGFPWQVVLAFWLVSLALSIIKKQRFAAAMLLLLLFLPPAILLLHSVIPFPRTFAFYSVALPCIIFLPWKELLTNKYIIPFVIAFQVFQGYLFYRWVQQSEHWEIAANQVAKEILGPHRYCVNHGLFDAILLFHLDQARVKDYSFDYYPVVRMNADTMNACSYLIMSRGLDETKHKRPSAIASDLHIYRWP